MLMDGGWAWLQAMPSAGYVWTTCVINISSYLYMHKLHGIIIALLPFRAQTRAGTSVRECGSAWRQTFVPLRHIMTLLTWFRQHVPAPPAPHPPRRLRAQTCKMPLTVRGRHLAAGAV